MWTVSLLVAVMQGPDPLNLNMPKMCKLGSKDNPEPLTDEQLLEEFETTRERLQDMPLWMLENPLVEMNFDTGFYSGQKPKYWEYGGNLYMGNDINFLGIGMYEGALGHDLDTAIKRMEQWKEIRYGTKPRPEAYYWLEWGWNYWNPYVK